MKEQSFPKTLGAFLTHFVSMKPSILLTPLFASSANTLKVILIPYVLKIIIDTISSPEAKPSEIFYDLQSAVFFGAVVWISLLSINRLHYILQVRIIPQFEANMRMGTVRYALKHSYEFFSSNLAGNIVNKVMVLIRASEAIRKITTFNIGPALAVTTTGLILIYSIAPIFSIVIGGWIGIQILICFFFVKYLNQASMENAEHKSIISGIIADIISNVASVKLFARESYELNNIQTKQADEIKSHKKVIQLMGYFCMAIDILMTLLIVSVFWLLIDGWQRGNISPGDIVFVFYMVFSIMNQLWLFGYALADLLREVGVGKEAIEVIAKNPSVTDKENALPIAIMNGNIEFKSVCFSYEGRDSLFTNLNIKICKGEKIGIVGASGSGKSTFVNLLLRFYDIESGEILIDNQNISNATQESLRKQICVIPQDTNLFHRSIRENILYGNPTATPDDVVEAARRSQCEQFIDALPQKYLARVGEKGTRLSGGQRQRVSIARAILKDAPIMILDEATSSLDSIAENLIQESLEAVLSKKTVIIIAHRLSTLEKVDRVLVFENGKVIEDGSHSDLLSREGQYAKLYNQQSKKYGDGS